MGQSVNPGLEYNEVEDEFVRFGSRRREGGTVPLMLLVSRYSAVRFVSRPRVAGIVP